MKESACSQASSKEFEKRTHVGVRRRKIRGTPVRLVALRNLFVACRKMITSPASLDLGVNTTVTQNFTLSHLEDC